MIKLVEQCLTELARIHQALRIESAARKQAEQALFQLTAITQSSMDAIISTDLTGRILHWNPGAERVYGYTAAEAIGQSVTDLIDPATVIAGKEPLAFVPVPMQQHKVTHRRKNGELVEVGVTLSPIQNAAGTVIGLSLVAYERRDRQEVERLKDELIGIVNHEFRTPLTAIQGASELLLMNEFGHLSASGYNLLTIIARNTDRLVQLTNNLFDLNQLASRALVLEMQSCNLADLMQQTTTAMQSLAARAGVELCVTPLSTQLTVDPTRIHQVLTQLISNAVKVSHVGDRIWLTAELKYESDRLFPGSAPYVLIGVKDEGEGIPRDCLESIFNRFQLVDASDARRCSGAGLGLAISRGIVQQHGGKLWGESVLGQGSTFYLALPVEQTHGDDTNTG